VQQLASEANTRFHIKMYCQIVSTERVGVNTPDKLPV